MTKNRTCQLTFLFLIVACAEHSTDQTLRYTDPFRENFKGEPGRIESFNYLIDSTGKMIRDSLHYEVGEWKDNYLRTYIDQDSSGRNKVFAAYTYHPNGKIKMITTTLNGRPYDRFETVIDSNGLTLYSSLYDSADKLTYIYKDIKENEQGQLLFSKIFDKDSVQVEQIEILYNKNIVSQTVFSDSSGKILSRSVYGLRDGDKVADTTTFYIKDSTSSVIKQFRYDGYDSLKNWLQRTELSANGKPVKRVKRSIVYAKAKE